MPLNLNRIPFRTAFPNDRAALVYIRNRFTQAAERKGQERREPVGERTKPPAAVVLGDGFRVPLPVYMILDPGLFTRPRLRPIAELLDDRVIGRYSPIYTDEAECSRAVQTRRPAGKRAAAVASPEQLWAVLALLLRAGVPRVVFVPDDQSYPLGDLLDLIPLPGHE